MRLLICTQAVDPYDSVLGFFVRWIEEFAERCEHVTVICLRKGNLQMPDNVEVIALGTQWRLMRVVEFLAFVIGRHKEYDTVLVHMNPEYLVVAGLVWRVMRKRIGLWYTHRVVNIKLRVATFFAHSIFTASGESFRLFSNKVHVTGHGIDTSFFKPDKNIIRSGDWLSVGRLMKTKRHDLSIRAASVAHALLRVVGEGPEREKLEVLAQEVGARVVFVGGVRQEELLREYQTASVLVHTSETGSLDKVVLEALACDCPVVTTSTAIDTLPVVVVEATPDMLAQAVVRNKRTLAYSSAEYVRMYHSLPRLIQSLCTELTSYKSV
jgi:glycosyltransferase involved in cell wall biosynthesis